MKFQFKFILTITLLFTGSALTYAQHTDVEFGYEGGGIIFESENMGIDASGVFESEFEAMNMDGSQVAEDPGFASNFTKGTEMFEVTSGDSIFLNVNQSSTLGSYLTYYNPVSGSFESTNATFTIEDNSPGMTSDLIISESGLMGDLSQFLITSTGDEIDTHVDYILSSGAAPGVYGLLLNIESDNAMGGLNNTTSDAFWVVFNNGLSEDDFEAGVSAFVVPEPSACVLLPIAFAAFLRRKRG